MNFLKKLVLLISVLTILNVASAGYDSATGRFRQQDPLGRGPRTVHSNNGPKWVGLNGPVVPSPQIQNASHIIKKYKIPTYIMGGDLKNLKKLLDGRRFLGTVIC